MTAPGAPPRRGWSAVVVARWLLVSLAAGAAIWALATVVPPGGRGGGAGPAGAGEGLWACPMHLEVTAVAPRKCPICNMDLVLHPTRRDTPGAGANTEIDLLLRYGMSPVQARTFPQEVRAPAWLEEGGVVHAVVYDDELEMLSPEERATFTPTAAPDLGVEVRLGPEPAARWDASTSRVRFRLAGAPPPGVRAGDAGWVTLPSRPHRVLVVPWTAVQHGAEGPYVMVASPDHRRAERRPLHLGKVAWDLGAVVSGARENERIAVDSAFFLDADQRLETAPR